MSAHFLYWEGAHASWHSMCALAEQMNMMMMMMMNPDSIMTTDNSMSGWGTFIDNKSTQVLWNEEESKMHINALKIKAVNLGVTSLCKFN